MLHTCAHCGCYVRLAQPTCPHCGALAPGVRVPSAAAALLGLALAGCPDPNKDAVALYGVEATDEDGDGWLSTEDCDDADETIHPEAEETPGDGIDSNCNDEDDT